MHHLQGFYLGDQWGSNPRPSEPQPDALTKLSYDLHLWAANVNLFG